MLRPQARSDLADRLRGQGAPLADVFTFLSGLYFRGKLAYASFFADPPGSCPGVLVITPCWGLLTPETILRAEDLRLFQRTDIRKEEDAYTLPLAADARRLASRLETDTDVILLGSIATGKYLKALSSCFGSRLKFPRDFVGRGDMSRGGLLLRRVDAGEELAYIPAEGAVFHGKKPPRLVPRGRACRTPRPGKEQK